MNYDQHVTDWHDACVDYISGLWAWDDSMHPRTIFSWCEWAELAEFDEVVE